MDGGLGRRRSDWAGRSVRVFMVDGRFGFGFHCFERNDGVCYLDEGKWWIAIVTLRNDVSLHYLMS